MKKRTFEGFGTLEWLETKEFWSGPWKPVCAARDVEEGKAFDIVTDGKEYRYSVI